MRINKLLAILLLGSFIFSSCNNVEVVEPKGDYEKGILVSGEGAGGNSGSISFISNDLNTVSNQIYKKVNSAELSTFLQSLAFDDARAFIIVDNQNAITAVNRYTFEKLGTITTGLETPRYMTVLGNKGYVTNWGTSGAFVAVVDLTTNSVESKIDISSGPERILNRNGKLYVSHKGGFGSNNVISVIDIASKSVQEITVKDNPDELFFNAEGNLVVLSEGRTLYDSNWNVTGHTDAAISTINLTNNNVSEVVFTNGIHPSLMTLNNQSIYYSIGNKVYKMGVTDTSLPASELLTIELFSTGYSSFYGMAVNEGRLYALNTKFSDVSELQVINLASKSVEKKVEAPVGASKIYFN